MHPAYFEKIVQLMDCYLNFNEIENIFSLFCNEKGIEHSYTKEIFSEVSLKKSNLFYFRKKNQKHECQPT